MMKTVVIISSLFLFLILTYPVYAQPALDIKTGHQIETQTVQPTILPTTPPKESSPQSPSRNQPLVTPEITRNQPNTSLSSEIKELQNRLSILENQAKKDNQNLQQDPKVVNWLTKWWQIGFWGGILLLIPWIFVGWQWTHFKFWGFGWPWPWWFWIPLFWFIPWLIIGWWWWLDWWIWWVWIWWLFPWIFWFFWWVIVFKELNFSFWHRRQSPYKDTASP